MEKKNGDKYNMKGHTAKYDLAEFWQAVFGTQHPKQDIDIFVRSCVFCQAIEDTNEAEKRV